MPELQPGDPRRLGSYEILERLGEGGQGVVYLGVDGNGAKAAIKLLRADLTEDASARNRFVREAQAAKQVARFCTAQVLEADMAGDRPYIASEYVPGPSLYRQITQEGPITGAALERLAIGMATALVAIHQAGIVHRDFKPHNVIMAPDGPRVIDFGIARALDVGQTAATKAIGTPSYMAPEQVAGAQLTEAVDVWAWAATLVFAATARPPFGDDTVVAVINRVMNEPPSLQGVPADIAPLIAACLVKEPERRPTAQQLMMNLIGAGPVGQTRAEDAAQATTFLAEGEHMAAGAPLPPPHTTMPAAGGGTQRVSPAAYAGTLPPAPGFDDTRDGGYGGGGYGGGYEPERRSKMPIVAAVVAIAVLALVVGIAMAKMGGDGKPSDSGSPAPSTSASGSQSEDDTPSEQPTRTRRPRTVEPTTEAPTTPTERPTVPTEEPTTPATEPTVPTKAPTEPTKKPPKTGGPGGTDPGAGGQGHDTGTGARQ
ncbi:serine/threonine-protein kinase [Actinomadura macrotermitis]|uniref:Serine/threonine-protein kinase PknD n=1 Tax=Actinomadura macrotermitis TaxID=2585200 RepID=A0A7K0BS12_9ACTN|nr:serine/threonine-protein kinase [Actinomadura macrotermitis]MQY03816.1 Serine/threonine-protein kinase PknD [Actinomadura macrotermitis]